MAKHAKTVVGSIKQKLLKRLLPVRIEFPQENETVVSSLYTFRMVVPEAAVSVDLCIDQGDWMPCRESVGLWWFDWTDFDNGEHEAVCRIRQQDGTVLVSEPRIFFVKRG
ncbi:MAG: hypothetical protein HY928_01585 [Elusimicrobia bacterium]|nr:hypothetical protein [Elusimicrobiota bacterium]